MDGISQLIYDRPSQSPGGFYENDLALAMRVVDLFDAVDRNRLGPDSDTQRQRDDNRADSHTRMVSGDRRLVRFRHLQSGKPAHILWRRYESRGHHC